MPFHIEKYKYITEEDLNYYEKRNPDHKLMACYDIEGHPHGRYWFLYQHPKPEPEPRIQPQPKDKKSGKKTK